MGFSIGEVKAGTANLVEGTQNIGTQSGGSLLLSAENKAELSQNMREILSAMTHLNDFLNHEAGGRVPPSLYNDSERAIEDAAEMSREVRRINGGEVSPETKKNANAYLAFAEATLTAAKELYQDAGPILDKAMPAIGVVRRIFGL